MTRNRDRRGSNCVLARFRCRLCRLLPLRSVAGPTSGHVVDQSLERSGERRLLPGQSSSSPARHDVTQRKPSHACFGKRRPGARRTVVGGSTRFIEACRHHKRMAKKTKAERRESHNLHSQDVGNNILDVIIVMVTSSSMQIGGSITVVRFGCGPTKLKSVSVNDMERKCFL